MHTLLRELGIVLGPREARILQTAFDRAWARVSTNHLEQSSNDAAAIRRQLAQKLIRLIQAGVRDPKRLATLACASLEAAPMQNFTQQASRSAS
jgi:hypothetical protein